MRQRLAGDFGSFSDILAGWARVHPDRLALRDDTGELTWRQLDDQIERLAARLVGTGLEKGQAVAILGLSSAAYAIVFLAAVRAGGVAAPLTTSANRAQLEGMASDSGARHLFIDAAKRAELGGGFMPELDHIALEDIGDWMCAEGEQAPAFAPDAKDHFNIIYSSGTTGVPKGIIHSHAMRWRQFASTAAAYHKVGLDIRALASTPLYSNTTMVCFLATMLAGGTLTLMGKFDCGRWLELAQDHRISMTMLVPVQYQRLMDYPHFDAANLSALTMKYCTSAPFSADLKREVLRRMPGALNEIYSMTEGGVVCLLEAHKFPDKLHTVGRPAPGSEMLVLDDDDQPVAPGQAGNLIGRSQTMMAGYKNQPGKTQEGYWTNPETGEVWQRMGDIGRVDADGFVELVGRAKDMIISGGFNIYPSDLEAALAKDERVTEAAVIGMPSRKWGESPVGFVTLRPGTNGDAIADIMARANSQLGKTQRLAALHAVDQMPRSHIGKLLKTDLRAYAETLAPID